MTKLRERLGHVDSRIRRLRIEDAGERMGHPRAGRRVRHVISGQVFEHSEFSWEAFKEMALGCEPAGLRLIARLDPSNRRLWQLYNPTVHACLTEFPGPPERLRERSVAKSPSDSILEQLLTRLLQFRERSAPAERVSQFCERIGKQIGLRL